jgi:mannose-6-phosphate isomerase-like protein (cupin superfamily)
MDDLPHAHADLVQLFLLEEGGGTMRAETKSLAVSAPALVIVPAGSCMVSTGITSRRARS